MRVPNFGSAIFLIGLSTFNYIKGFNGVWISNIYSEDEYWRGTRRLDYDAQQTTMMTSTVVSNVYESIPSGLTSANFSSEFIGPYGEYQGFRDYEIHDRFSFGITSYDFEHNLRGKEVFFAISEPGPAKSEWESMFRGCNYWKSTISNYRGEIVGYRKIKLTQYLCESVVTTSAGFQFAQEFSRRVTKNELSTCGGIDQLKKLFVTQDQALMIGEINPQMTASGIILDTNKSIGFHLDQAKKLNAKNRFG